MLSVSLTRKVSLFQCGGQAGVSDTVASALWSLDFLPTLSKAGAVRMNLHGGPGGPYPPIAFEKNGSLQARPLYCKRKDITESRI